MGKEPTSALDVLRDIIRTERWFHSSCGIHRKPCNTYCFDSECRGQHYCSLCKPHHQHSNQLIQIYNATHKKAVLEQDVRALIDTSDIQKLINNGETVLYLSSRRTPRNLHEQADTQDKACKTCIYRFPPSVKDQRIGFCSINCKVEHCVMGLAHFAAQNGDSAKPTPSREREREVENSRKRLPSTSAPSSSRGREAEISRKRPRKQLRPHRSPFM